MQRDNHIIPYNLCINSSLRTRPTTLKFENVMHRHQNAVVIFFPPFNNLLCIYYAIRDTRRRNLKRISRRARVHGTPSRKSRRKRGFNEPLPVFRIGPDVLSRRGGRRGRRDVTYRRTRRSRAAECRPSCTGPPSSSVRSLSHRRSRFCEAELQHEIIPSCVYHCLLEKFNLSHKFSNSRE